MVHFEFGRDRLTQPHPLNAFELAQGAIKVPLEACFVTQQVIELRCERNVLANCFQLHSRDSIGALAVARLSSCLSWVNTCARADSSPKSHVVGFRL